MAGRVSFDLKGFEKLVADIGSDANPAMDRMFKLWGRRYLSDVQRRYIKRSKSPNAPWKELKPATARRRRQGKGRRGRRLRNILGRKPLILRDTGTLLGALDIGKPGNMFRRINRGIAVGYGGPSKHPEGKATIADIARFHDQGLSPNPEREIFIRRKEELRPGTIRGMQQDLARAFETLKRKSQF